jgi:exodeoxyribonuclease VII small subunit
MAKQGKESIGQSLSKLEAIVKWLDAQSEVDVEEGLAKVREGAKLVGELRERLKAVENEFSEVKRELETDAEDR